MSAHGTLSPRALTPAPNPPHPIPRRQALPESEARAYDQDPMLGLWLCWASQAANMGEGTRASEHQALGTFVVEHELDILFSR